MATPAQKTNTDCITLSGSGTLVCEYLDFAISTILFQRGVHPQDGFITTKQYDLTLFKLRDGSSARWIRDTLSHVQRWIDENRLIKFFLVISNANTKENLERWEFGVDSTDEKITVKGGYVVSQPGKSLKRIQLEIREVMRQISATVSFLPFIDCPCNFTLAVRCIPGTVFPPDWTTCDISVSNSEQVDIKSFGTGYHAISTRVHFNRDM